MSDNNIVVDFKKIQHARLFWRNNRGSSRTTKPESPTVLGSTLPDDPVVLERAKSRGVIDVWTPVCRMQLSARQWLDYQGSKGLQMWEAWKGFVFKKGRA